MPAPRRPLELAPETETYALRRHGRRGFAVRGQRVDFDRPYLRAWFPDHRVRRRRVTSSDLWLVHVEEGPIAVALKEAWPLGLRYRVEWDGGALVLVGARASYLWEVFDGDEVVGELLPEPFTDGDRRMTLPAGTPDDVARFVVAVTELARHHPALRLFDRATRPLLWS